MAFPDLESRTIHTNGHRFRVHIAGTSGPLVLLCHGFPESWYSWRHQLNALKSAGYRAVAMEMRGYGRSSKPTEISEYRVTELVQDCVDVVTGLNESHAVIVGHDLGSAVAWAAAWTRPDVFTAVVGMSVPFGGRGLHALPGDPFGNIRPSVAHRELGGPDSVFYQEHHRLPGGVGEEDAEKDIRSWMTKVLCAVSADGPLPPEFQGIDLINMPVERLPEYVRSTMCLPPGEGYSTALPEPDRLPDWLHDEDIAFYAAEFEYSGLTGALNYYRAQDLNWEVLAGYQGKPVTVPSLFIGGDRDIATVWSQEAILRADEMLSDHRGSVIVANCGHWIQQEHPEVVNEALIKFLNDL